MSEKDGGPAFPGEYGRTRYDEGGSATPLNFTGMSLRDWFAGQSIFTAAVALGDPADSKLDALPSAVAKRAYEIADALLAERAKQDT